MVDNDNRKNKPIMTPGKMKDVDRVLEQAKESRKIARERISSGNFSKMPKEIEELFS